MPVPVDSTTCLSQLHRALPLDDSETRGKQHMDHALKMTGCYSRTLLVDLE